ncbi:MAG TPA: methyltransferase domain-containing protein [bacterium]|nr:methyltransferase domain-containing protein [bacterium]
MTKRVYLLQFGDFKQLSKAEAYAFVTSQALNSAYEGFNYLIFESPKTIDPYFGSILRVAEYYSSVEGLIDVLREDLAYAEKSIPWSIYVLDDNIVVAGKLRHKIELLIKQSNKKSVYVNSTSLFSEKGGVSLTRAIRKRLATDGYEFILARWGTELAVWRTIKHLDLRGFRERDLSRPYKNPLISMPPWLARVMINLASPSPGRKLLDPFCGTGTILIEAVDSGLDAYGVDLDPSNVNGARENLNWFQTKKSKTADSHVVLADSRHLTEHFPEEYFDVAVTEPPFGPPLKEAVSLNEAQAIADNLRDLYSSVFYSLSKVLKKSGTVVFTLPSWKLKSGGLYELRVEEILEKSGLKLNKHIGKAILPIRWSKPDNIIQRLINVASKPSS